MSGQIVIDLEATGYPSIAALANQMQRGHEGCRPSSCCLRMVADAIRAHDKPAEPTGLGAVVEDAAGHLWIRSSKIGGDPWRAEGPIVRSQTWFEWGQIDAVRVLSEGIQ